LNMLRKNVCNTTMMIVIRTINSKFALDVQQGNCSACI
jgi:hypothetical protein